MRVAQIFRPWRRPGNRSAERVLRAIPAILYCVMIFTVSGTEGRRIPVVMDDRLAHFLEYLGLGILVMLALAGWGERLAAGHYAGGWLYGSLFAISDEWHQRFVPGRYPSAQDALFDVFGVTIALMLVLVMTRDGARP